jgi:2-C-methyl-D-erythritol 2,4-cyclodiphosphate synthase
LRIGHGYDAHKLISGRKLVIGGVTIPHEKGLDGHSDADVLLHAVIDALLGAAGLGDIGGMFPDNDPAYKNADSIELLKSAFSEIKTRGFVVGNIDATVIAQAPMLKTYISQMRLNIALACKTAPENVNVKATTEERMGFTGRLEGIAAHAVCLIDLL